jgi:hypothetical protein
MGSYYKVVRLQLEQEELHIVKDVLDKMKLSIHLVIHPWHVGNNHVAIDLIV